MTGDIRRHWHLVDRALNPASSCSSIGGEALSSGSITRPGVNVKKDDGPVVSSSWAELPDNDERWLSHVDVTATPVDPQLELLPTHEMTWPSFERLLLRIAKDVRGLRHARLYGVPGQSQEGLDLVGRNSQDEIEGVQGKRYQKFDEPDLNKAVKKYLDGSLPFPICRLAIGVSCQANGTGVVNRLIELKNKYEEIEFEIWDRDWISDMLRSRPEIVREFFGQITALSFCHDFIVAPLTIPPLDAVAIADAVMRGPAVTSGAIVELDAARSCRAADPSGAVEHLRLAQGLLRNAGFTAHANVLDDSVAEALEEAGKAGDAADILLDGIWYALEADEISDALHRSARLATLAERSGSSVALAMSQLGEMAVATYRDPLGREPALEAMASEVPVHHSGRMVLLACELALACGRTALDPANVSIAELLLGDSAQLPESTKIRLALCLSDFGGDWSRLLGLARSRQIPREFAALVLARHARSISERAEPSDGELEWGEAVEQGCLAKINSDAANWLLSQRMAAHRGRTVLEDVYRPIAQALRAEPGRASVVAASPTVREGALSDLQSGRLAAAAVRLQRQLRDAVVGASWAEEQDARRMLADVLRASGEFELAAHHLIRAGLPAAAHALGVEANDRYLVSAEHLDSPNYWSKAAAYRLVAAQADLVPDDQVGLIAEKALWVFEQVSTGVIRDAPMFSPSVYLGSLEALAGIATRLSLPQAERLLLMLEPLAPVDKKDGYRFSDKSQAIACTGIGKTFPQLRHSALDQLLILLGRSGHSLSSDSRTLIADDIEYCREELERQRDADGVDASELLAHVLPESVDMIACQRAGDTLMAPTSSSPGSYSLGTDAIHQSIVAMQLPRDRRFEIINHQLLRCKLPHEGAINRTEYLLAAANLTDGLTVAQREGLFDETMALINESLAYEVDDLERAFNHPLGSFRMTNDADHRPAAAFLAAMLATTDANRAMVQSAALRLLGSSDGGDFWLTRALQELRSFLSAEAIPFLARMGPSLRSLAAIAWTQTDELGASLGLQLAIDTDPSVRRTLAEALSVVPATTRTEPVEQKLAEDPRFSVRSALLRLGERSS